MQTIDEISIGREGDMFTLTIYSYGSDGFTGDDEARTTAFLIGLPDQFHTEVERTIGRWLTLAVDDDEKKHAERVIAQRPASDWPYTPHPVTDAQEGDDD